VGADHLKILENSTDKVKNINKSLKNFEIKLSSPFEYLKNLKYEKKLKGELLNNDSNYILQGVYSAIIFQKEKNVRLSWLLGELSSLLIFYMAQNTNLHWILPIMNS
jgi:hypothetical protein